jgi:CubicO group peptidase (beta-lactamase class C family)
MTYRKKFLWWAVAIVVSGFVFFASESASAGTKEFLRFRLASKKDSTPRFEGFAEFVSGEKMSYFSHRNPNSTAYIARASEGRNVFEWKTAPVPENWQGEKASFLWVEGLGVNAAVKEFRLSVNGKERFIFTTRPDPAWTVKGIDGGELSFVAVTTDAYGDQFGYIKMTVPGSWLTPGQPLTLKVVGECAKSDVWVMTFQFPNAVSGLEPIEKDVFHTVRMRNQRMSSVEILSARQDWAGKTISLMCGEDTLGRAEFISDGEFVNTTIQMASGFLVNDGQALVLTVEGKEVDRLDSKEFIKERMKAFLDEELVFDQWIFPPGDFPKPTWKRPGMVDNEMGEFDLKVTFYDADYNRVEKADKPGRYGAVIEADLPEGYHFQRYFTLFCSKDRWNWWSDGLDLHVKQIAPLGIAPSAWNARQKTIDRCMGEALSHYSGGCDGGEMAMILAGVMDAGEKPADRDYTVDPSNLDRQWWVTFKRRQFGEENKYPPLKSPVKADAVKSPVLRKDDSASTGYSPEQIEAIREVCRQWVQAGKEPLAVLVAHKGVIVLQEPFGEFPDGKKMTMETPTWMASITKLMTGCLMMQFVDQGLIDLDDPVSKYLPELNREVRAPLTIRHLFTHTNGFWGHTTWGGDRNNYFENAVGQYLPYLEVGKKHQYNGDGYALAGKVMERVSGKAIPYLFQEQLFEPLAADHTTVQSTSYDARSVCMDIARIGQMLLNRGSYGNVRFFGEDTFQKMMPIKLDRLVPGLDMEWGIGIVWDNYLSQICKTFGHGAASGAILQIDPQNELVIVCCRDQTGLDYSSYAEKFMRACTAPFYKYKKEEPSK